MNIASIVFYLLTNLRISFINIIGASICLVTIAIDFGLISFNFKYVERTDKNTGRWIKNFTWIYISLFLLSAILICLSALGNMAVNAPPYDVSLLSILIINAAGFLIIYGMGLFISFYNMRNLNNSDAWK